MNTKNGTTWFRAGHIMGVAFFVTIGFVVLPLMAQAQDNRATLLSEMTSSAVGQSFEGRLEARTFGTPPVSHTVSGIAFTGLDVPSLDRWASNSHGSRGCAIDNCILAAPLQLPAGALIIAIELDACDTNPAFEVNISLLQVGANEGPNVTLAAASTSGTPGCGFVTTFLPTPHTVNNLNNTYHLRYTGAVDLTTRIQAVRVFYSLQISPAPGVATFSDVPTTHPFFRFVEALRAAGITGGCLATPPMYCPDDPVTRGQMAVFLSRALGLHFSP